MHPGPRDADIQEAALLGEGGVVLLRLADREDPLLQAGQEHGVPLEALRPVVGQEVDAVGRPLALVGGASLELRDDRRGIGGRVRGGDPVHDRQQRLERGLALARLVALGGPVLLVAHGLGPAGPDGVGEVRANGLERGPPEAGHRGAHLRPRVEAQAAHLVGDAGPGQRLLDRGELGVHPDQDGDLRPGRSPPPASRGSRPPAPPAPAPPMGASRSWAAGRRRAWPRGAWSGPRRRSGGWRAPAPGAWSGSSAQAEPVSRPASVRRTRSGTPTTRR